MNVRVAARNASVALKLVAVLAGGIAAYFWYRSAVTGGALWNEWAALVTALSVALQAISLLIDSFWVAPTASWGP